MSCSTSCGSRTGVRTESSSMKILGTTITCSGTRTSCGAKASTNSCFSISGTGTSSIGARMICSTVRRWTSSCGLTSESRQVGSPWRQAGDPRSTESRGCLPPGEENASGTWPCSASRDPPPRPLPSSVSVELCGGCSRQGPLRRLDARAVATV